MTKKSPTVAESRHMAAVASLGCIVCRTQRWGITPPELTAVHHITEGRGLSQRTTHFEVIPLCAQHHQTGGHGVAIHAGERVWEARFGTERLLLAATYLLLKLMARHSVNGPLCDCEYCQGEWLEFIPGIAPQTLQKLADKMERVS